MSELAIIGSVVWPGNPGVLHGVTLREDGTWSGEMTLTHPDGSPPVEIDDPILAMVASDPYTLTNDRDWWGPANGQPGHAILADVARRFGGTVELVPIPGPRPVSGIVY